MSIFYDKKKDFYMKHHYFINKEEIRLIIDNIRYFIYDTDYYGMVQSKTLAVYILNPFMYIYYYTNEKDFISGEEKNFFYFLINVILAVIISFFGCVYNEVIILS